MWKQWSFLWRKYLGLDLQILKLVDNFNLKAYVLDKTIRKLINHAQFALTERSTITPKSWDLRFPGIWIAWDLRMGKIICSETSATNYRSTLKTIIIEETKYHLHHVGSLKPSTAK